MSDHETTHEPAVPCTAKTKRGTPCRSFASGDKQPPLCFRHGLSPQEAKEIGQRGAATTNESKLQKAARVAAEKVQQAIATLPPADVKIAIGNQADFTESLTSVMVAIVSGAITPTRARALQGFFDLRLKAEQLAMSAQLLEVKKRLDAMQAPGGIRRTGGL
jgi:hypothetical protein